MRLVIALMSLMVGCLFAECADDLRFEGKGRHVREAVVTYDVKIVEEEDMLVHVATYPDAIITTILTGEDKDWQVIWVDGIYVNCSDDIHSDQQCYWHKYNFGVVYTYPTHQQVLFY